MIPTMGGGFHLLLISLLYFAGSVATQDANITIPLNKTLTYENRELYGSYLTLNGQSNVQVNFSDVNETLDFIVFQAHSHMFNITLNMTDSAGTAEANGTNLGFVSFKNKTFSNLTFRISSYHKNVTVPVFISVHGYKEIDPIPGACNLKFPKLKINPFLYTQTFSDYILVEAASPSGFNDRKCINPTVADMKFYMMYLPEQNFYSEPYFTGLRRMMTLEGIKKYGTEIPYSTLPANRRKLSAYPGKGAIYAVVATVKNSMEAYNFTTYSVYVPSYSYGCNFADGGCEMIESNITIPLNKTLTYENKELYGSFLTLNGPSNVRVNFINVNETLEFIVLQAHSHLLNITLNMVDSAGTAEAIGTNLGFGSFKNKTFSNLTFRISSYHKNVTVRVFISVHGYKEIDPLPGGCNLEFLHLDIYPFVFARTFSDYILVEAGAPSEAKDRDCSKLSADMTFYMMYLPEQNFYSEPYFTGLRRMMTLEGIKKYGTEIPYFTLPVNRRMLSAYPGTGAIYAIVATDKNSKDANNHTGYSVYVPSYSYGCTDLADDGCEMIDGWLSQILCLALMFVGLFICFFGHRFFKTEMFFAGFFSGAIITYILVALITVVDKPALLAAAAMSGIFFGGIWWLFWWLYGIPVIAVLLPTLNLGFLLASIFYYRLPGHIAYLKWDFNFWSLFILVMMLTSLALVSISYAANIICCAVLGSYATVLSIDYYMGSNLKFIIINLIRRAVVPHFNVALLAPPDDQWRDVGVAFMWLVLATAGFMFQHWHNRGRPPFPPPPRAVRPSMAEPSVSSYGTISSSFRRPRNQQTIGADGSRTPIVSRIYNERTGLLE